MRSCPLQKRWSLRRKVGLSLLAVLGFCVVGLYTVPNFPFGPYTLYGDMKAEERAANIPYERLSSEETRPLMIAGKNGPFPPFANAVVKFADVRSCLVRSEQHRKQPDLRLIDWFIVSNTKQARVCIWRIFTSFEADQTLTIQRVVAWMQFHDLQPQIIRNPVSIYPDAPPIIIIKVYRPSETLLMLQGGFGSDEYDDGRRVQALDGEA